MKGRTRANRNRDLEPKLLVMVIRSLGIAVAVLFSLPSAIATPDPLPAHSVSRGKKLSFRLVETLLGKGVDIGTDYYFDYSNASFQREDHFWSEGKGTRYAGSISETYRRIDFYSPVRRHYQTETIIRNFDGTKKRFPTEYGGFSDWEKASRTRRKYRTENGALVLVETWLMRYDFRVRNTYYKAAKFASKQLADPLSTKVHLKLTGLPVQIIDGKVVSEKPDTIATAELMTSKLGVSSPRTLPNNSRINSFSVDELYCPGTDE